MYVCLRFHGNTSTNCLDTTKVMDYQNIDMFVPTYSVDFEVFHKICQNLGILVARGDPFFGDLAKNIRS